jgi:hypothetical protein
MGSNSQLILILIVMGFSVISWIANYLKEQSRIRAAKEEQRRRYEEALRTGRPAEAPVRSADPAAELAARRQAQLQELRRQQMEDRARQGGVVVTRTGPAQGGTTMPIPPGAPGGGPARPGRGPVLVQRGPGAPNRKQTAPRPERDARSQNRKVADALDAQPRTGAAPLDPAKLGAVRERERLEREAALRAAHLAEDRRESARDQQIADIRESDAALARRSASAAAARGRFGDLGLSGMAKGMGRDELRRAIVLTELLGRPVADR